METLKKAPKIPTVVRPRGRPTRDQQLRRAIETAGIDPTLVDPRRILASIAVDPSAPASARVTAAKALLIAGTGEPSPSPQPPHDDQSARLDRRALEIATRRLN